jgi:glycosyltransferase involved in cell wall biosynthesis
VTSLLNIVGRIQLMFELSVIICSHNPRSGYLSRVLSALEQQTLPKQRWELLLVDNASGTPLSMSWDISWHQFARHIREEELGLTPARLRGIGEARGDIIVFVDDDNVLDEEYLTAAGKVANTYPFLGAWGGTIRPEFESQPEPWTKPLWSDLAIREFDRPYWSNNPGDWYSQPCGAGLCIRRCVADRYVRMIAQNFQRRLLGRRGGTPTSEEDHDIVRCAVLEGYGFGVFPDLLMTHLIPSWRLTEEYLLKLTAANAFSSALLEALWGKPLPALSPRWERALKFVWTFLRRGRRPAMLLRARQDGLRRVHDVLNANASFEKSELSS